MRNSVAVTPKKRTLIFINIIISCIATSMLATALTTALLTSLRTIAGAIGMAVFVAIMTVVADHSAASYGDNAPIHGLNMAFWAMSLGSAALLLIAVFGVKRRPGTNQS